MDIPSLIPKGSTVLPLSPPPTHTHTYTQTIYRYRKPEHDDKYEWDMSAECHSMSDCILLHSHSFYTLNRKSLKRKSSQQHDDSGRHPGSDKPGIMLNTCEPLLNVFFTGLWGHVSALRGSKICCHLSENELVVSVWVCVCICCYIVRTEQAFSQQKEFCPVLKTSKGCSRVKTWF